MTPSAQAKQALKAALNGQQYGVVGGVLDGIGAFSTTSGDVLLSKEAARLIDAMLTRAHYEGELEKAEREE